MVEDCCCEWSNALFGRGYNIYQYMAYKLCLLVQGAYRQGRGNLRRILALLMRKRLVLHLLIVIHAPVRCIKPTGRRWRGSIGI